MTTKKHKKKNQKPTKIDAHFRYVCPNPDCVYDHWISLKETQTKNFKIVCDCNTVFKPKQILKLKILYKTQPQKKITKQPKIVKQPKITLALSNKCVKILTGYGFTEQESVILTNNGFVKNPCDDPTILVKYILQNIGDLLNESTKTTNDV